MLGALRGAGPARPVAGAAPCAQNADGMTHHHAPDSAMRRLLDGVGVGEAQALWATRAGRVLVASVAAIFLCTVVGLAALWPGDRAVDGGLPSSAPTRAAVVTAVREAACPGQEDAGAAAQQCRTITVEVAGDAAPRSADIDLGPADGGLALERGDRIRVSENPPLEGVQGGVEPAPFSLVGVDHSRSLLIAAGLLGLLAVVALRGRGLLALLGVGLSLALLVEFLVPAILAGRPPVLVALVGALAVMFVTLVLTNGVGAQTLAGALGIAMTLVLTTVLGLIAVRATGLDGTGSELSITLAQAATGVSLEGVLLAGMVIGGLGVLADTAVTQASAVMALRRANPSLPARGLYREAVQVGRDHLSATIHTLVLAYAGATLPLLLVLEAGGASTVDTINQTDIAEPILATIIGCAGLVAAVPLATGLAAALVARVPVAALPDDHHGHHH